MPDKKDDHTLLSDEDRSLWQRVADTVKRSLPIVQDKALPDVTITDQDVKKRVITKAHKTPPPKPSVKAPEKPKGRALDARTLQRLKQGKIAIDETIDLHGMTQDQAHALLKRRVMAGHQNGKRLILVITGKGLRSGEGGGVLKNALPLWCGMPPLSDIILQRTIARPQHGGSGAVYLYLRRKRQL